MVRNRIVNLALLIGSVLVFAAAAELLLRVLLPQHFDPHPRGMYSADRNVGYILTPNFTGTFRRTEFEHPVRINGQGLRGGPSRSGPASAYRVVCLGDSFTWGYGVQEHETYPARLQDLLAARYPKADVQVVNAGVPGYGTADELRFLRSRKELLDPDLVILQFLADNDFTENRRPALGRIAVEDGWLRADEPPRPQPLRTLDWLKARSHLIKFLSERIGYLAVRTGVLAPDAAGGSFTPADAARTRELLIEIVEAARALGAPTLIVFSTGQAAILGDDAAADKAAAVVAEAAAASGAAMIDLTPRLRAHPDRLRMYYPLDGHWTATANAAVAAILAHEIARQHGASIRERADAPLASST